MPASSAPAQPVASGQTAAQQSKTEKKGMGTLRTSVGSLVFDRIENKSMGRGELTVSEFGAKVIIPLSTIKKITFLEKNAIRIDYVDGRSEETIFHCSKNLAVTFIAGDKEIYYGDCQDFSVVKEIEFHGSG